MTTNVDQILLWIKDFKNTWLCQHLSHEVYLRNLINLKLNELEELLHQNQREETSPSFDDQYHSPENNLSITIANHQQTPQRSLPTPPDIHPQSDDDQLKNDESMCECRPVIYIKRILFEEAETYLPNYPNLTKNTKKTQKRKVKSRFSTSSRANRRKKKAAKLIMLSDDATPEIETRTKESQLVATPLKNGRSKEKRRLRPIDAADDDLSMMANGPEIDLNLCSDEYGPITRQIGRDGLLSQTRKTSDQDQDEIRLVLQTRSAVTVIESAVPSGEKSSIPMAIYPDGIEDISNDGVDPPASPSIPFVGHVSSLL